MYKLTMKVAWLNLVRRLRRSMMVVLMIVFSLGGLLSLQGLYDGMYQQMIDNVIRSDCGELSVYAPDYRLSKSLDDRIGNAGDVAAVLETMPEVRAFTVRLHQEGLLATARKSHGATVIGVDLGAERRFGQLDLYVDAGEYGFGEKGNGVILGSVLADNLGLEIGSRVIFSAQNAQGEIVSVSLRVLGTLKTNNLFIDEQAAYMPMAAVRTMLQVDEGGATQIAVSLGQRDALERVQQHLQARFKQLEVLRWDELYPLLVQMQEMVDTFNSVSYLIVFIVAALGIFGVMLVSVLERLREFGILLAIGTPYRMVRNQVIFEAVILGFMGYLGGSLLGGGTLWLMHVYGLDLSAMSAGMESFGMNAVVIAQIKPAYFGDAFLSVFFASALSVLWPLRVLKKLHPVDVIREN